MADWLLFPLLGLLLLNGLMYLLQPRMLFFPSRVLDATPADWGLDYEDLTIRTDDGVALNGWFIPREGARRVVLFLHGNAGNISHRRDSVQIFHALGLHVLIIDYRGYGRSGGAPDEAGLYRDAAAAWGYLTRDRGFDAAQVLIFGRSLGGAVAAHLAAEVKAGGVILESSFSSARDVAHRVFPLLSRLVVLRYRFDAAGDIARARSPVMVLHSPDDEIMPFELGRRLYEAAPEPRRFVTLRGDHNGGFIVSRPAYDEALADFVASLGGTPRQRPAGGR
jgi:fermentation-respiration switch protein FrsA (DUF1100 family)